LVSLDRRGGFADRTVAMAAFLEQTAVVGVQRLETGERGECVGDATEIALADSNQVPNVAVLRYFGQQHLRRRQRLGELALLEQTACTANLGLDA